MLSARGASTYYWGFTDEISAEEGRARARHRRSRAGRWRNGRRTGHQSQCDGLQHQACRFGNRGADPDDHARGHPAVGPADDSGCRAPDHREQQRRHRPVVHQRLLGFGRRRVAAWPRPQQHPRARQRPPARELRPGRRRPRVVSRPLAAPVRRRRAHRSPEGRCVRDLRLRRRGRRGQRHPAPAVHRLHRHGHGWHDLQRRGQPVQGVRHRRHRRPHEGQVQRVPLARLPEAGCLREHRRQGLHGQQRPAVDGLVGSAPRQSVHPGQRRPCSATCGG